MQLVPRDDPGERTGAHRSTADGAAAAQRLVAQILEEREAGSAHRPPLLDQRGERPRIELRSCNEVVLVESWQRRRIGACQPERTVAEDPLAVGEVREYLADAPRPGRIAVAGARLADGREERRGRL